MARSVFRKRPTCRPVFLALDAPRPLLLLSKRQPLPRLSRPCSLGGRWDLPHPSPNTHNHGCRLPSRSPLRHSQLLTQRSPPDRRLRPPEPRSCIRAQPAPRGPGPCGEFSVRALNTSSGAPRRRVTGLQSPTPHRGSTCPFFAPTSRQPRACSRHSPDLTPTCAAKNLASLIIFASLWHINRLQKRRTQTNGSKKTWRETRDFRARCEAPLSVIPASRSTARKSIIKYRMSYTFLLH